MKNLIFKLLALTVFLNIWIPKGGMKISGIPLTIGNIVYFLLIILFILYILFTGKIAKSKISFCILISVIVFAIRLLLAEGYGNYDVNTIVSYITPLCVFPLIYMIAYQLIDNEEKLNTIVKIVVYGFIFVSLYSILQIIFGINEVAIPGITVNYSDFKESPLWYLQKANNIGSYSKIVSTYQNGNIFGVNLILFFPLVFEFVKSFSNRKAYLLLLIFLFVAFMTLSRTCWLGMGIYLLLRFIFNKSKRKLDLVVKALIIVILPIIVSYIFKQIPQLGDRLLQTNLSNVSTLSGRAPDAISLLNSTSDNILSIIIGPYGIIKYSGGAYEMTYLAIYMLSGIVGLVIWFIPIISALVLFRKYKNNIIAKGVFYGIITWSIIAFVEGAFWLPPTGLNLWLILALGVASIKIEKINNYALKGKLNFN